MMIKDYRYRHFEPVLAQDFEPVQNLISKTHKAIISVLIILFFGGLLSLIYML